MRLSHDELTGIYKRMRDKHTTNEDASLMGMHNGYEKHNFDMLLMVARSVCDGKTPIDKLKTEIKRYDETGEVHGLPVDWKTL